MPAQKHVLRNRTNGTANCKGQHQGMISSSVTGNPSCYLVQALANWPPTTKGSKAFAKRWWAKVHGNALVLAGEAPADKPEEVPMVPIPLEGTRQGQQCKLATVVFKLVNAVGVPQPDGRD